MMDPATRARAARTELETAVLDYLRAHPEGRISSQIAKDLGLDTGFSDNPKHYLSYALLGDLVAKGLIVRGEDEGRKPYRAV